MSSCMNSTSRVSGIVFIWNNISFVCNRKQIEWKWRSWTNFLACSGTEILQTRFAISLAEPDIYIRESLFGGVWLPPLCGICSVWWRVKDVVRVDEQQDGVVSVKVYAGTQFRMRGFACTFFKGTHYIHTIWGTSRALSCARAELSRPHSARKLQCVHWHDRYKVQCDNSKQNKHKSAKCLGKYPEKVFIT